MPVSITRSFIRQELLVDQRDCQGSEGGSILHRSRNLLRKRSLVDLLRVGTRLLPCLRFQDHRSLGRKIEHLAAFDLQDWLAVQILMAIGTFFHRMHDDLIGSADLGQGAAFVTWLRSWFLAAGLAQAFPLGLPCEAVGGRGQMASMAVFGQTTLQLLDVRAQVFYPRLQRQPFGYQSPKPGMFFPKGCVFFSKPLAFVLRHVFTVLFWGRFGKGSRSPE
jgi:hypothetical protein